MAKRTQPIDYDPPPVRKAKAKRARKEAEELRIAAAAEAAQASPPTKQYAPFEITEERIKDHYAAIGFFDWRKLFNPDWSLRRPDEWDDATAYAVAGLDLEDLWGQDDEEPDIRKVLGVIRKFKTSDKLRALRDLAEMRGMMKGAEDERNKDRLKELVDAIDRSPQ